MNIWNLTRRALTIHQNSKTVVDASMVKQSNLTSSQPVIIREYVTDFNFQSHTIHGTGICTIHGWYGPFLSHKSHKNKATLYLQPSFFNIEDLISQVAHPSIWRPQADPKSSWFQWCLCCPPKRWCCSHLGRCHVWWRHNAKRTGDSERLVRWHKRKKKGFGKPVPSRAATANGSSIKVRRWVYTVILRYSCNHNRGAMKGAISSGFSFSISNRLGRFDFDMFFSQQVWLGECEKIVSVDMMKWDIDPHSSFLCKMG